MLSPISFQQREAELFEQNSKCSGRAHLGDSLLGLNDEVLEINPDLAPRRRSLAPALLKCSSYTHPLHGWNTVLVGLISRASFASPQTTDGFGQRELREDPRRAPHPAGSGPLGQGKDSPSVQAPPPAVLLPALTAWRAPRGAPCVPGQQARSSISRAPHPPGLLSPNN